MSQTFVAAAVALDYHSRAGDGWGANDILVPVLVEEVAAWTTS